MPYGVDLKLPVVPGVLDTAAFTKLAQWLIQDRIDCVAFHLKQLTAEAWSHGSGETSVAPHCDKSSASQPALARIDCKPGFLRSFARRSTTLFARQGLVMPCALQTFGLRRPFTATSYLLRCRWFCQESHCQRGVGL